MFKGKRILITGISGINVEGSIKKFMDYCASKENRIEKLYCINDYIHNTVKERFTTISWHEILTYPNKILNELWRKAMLDINNEIKKHPERNYILAIHSCYYHQFTQEFISFVNLEDIREYDPDSIITFIDDVDDIHLRLKQEGRIFSQELGGASEDDIENLFELLKILDWRANETVLSRFYSNQLNKDHYLFAVKHPIDTLYRLCFDSNKYLKIYLSHPISKIRSLLFQKKSAEANSQIDPITHITHFLSERSICFFPTTIDEYRLDAETIEIKHSQRWEEQIYLRNNSAILYIPPNNSGYLPYSETVLSAIIQPRVNNVTTDRKRIQLHHLLNHFLKEVSKQIGIRDKMLVEQADVLFVSRPYLNGRISDGVKTEIEYIKKLHPDKNKLGIVYFPKEDYKDTQIFQVREGLPAFLYESKMFVLEGNNEDNCKKVVTESFGDKIFSNFGSETGLAKVMKEIITELLKRHIITKHPNYKEKALDSQAAITMEAKYMAFSKKVISTYNAIVTELNETFILFEDEYQTENVINNFLKSNS